MSFPSSGSVRDEDDGDGEEIEVSVDDNLDLYAVLNVPKNATVEEINKSYRQKCLIFHPDRHNEPAEKIEAEKYFVKLQTAYETLSDPQQRAIYDAVGLKGLELHGWELIPRPDNVENILREYEFLKRLRETEIMLQKVHPSGTFAFKTSFVGLLTKDPEMRCGPQMTGLTIQQTCDSALSPIDKVGISGRVKVNNGRGDGSCVVHWKRVISSSSLIETSCTLSPDSFTFGFKYAGSILPKTSIVIEPSIHYFPLYSAFSPAFSFIVSRNLHPRWHGSIVYNWSLEPSLTTALLYTKSNEPKFGINLTVSPSSSNIRLEYIKRNLAHDSVLHTSCLLSVLGVMPAINYEQRLSRYSRIGCSLSVSLPNCILNAKFKLKTGTSAYEYHVLLCDCEEDIARATLYGVIIPFVTFHVVKRVFRSIFDRFASIFEDRLEERKVDALRQEEASNIISLMRRTAERIAQEEKQKGGLIIVEAKYGQMTGGGSNALAYPILGDRITDVTVPLQAMVNDSQLRIYSGKSHLPGFYDPCPLEPKMLRVVYKYKDRMHSVSVLDETALHIPMACMFFIH